MLLIIKWISSNWVRLMKWKLGNIGLYNTILVIKPYYLLDSIKNRINWTHPTQKHNLQMIQENSADKRQSLYLYTGEGSYGPLARIDRNGNQEQQHIYYFHTNLKGMSEELTDEAGEIVWECSYQLWGKPVQEIAHREIQQNLRYQRQYSDRENGQILWSGYRQFYQVRSDWVSKWI